MISAVLLSAFNLNTAHANAANYTVEVIVFENFTQKAWTEEFWPADAPLASTQNSFSLLQPARAPLWMGQAGKSLTATANKMVSSKGYKILYHQAWSQAAATSAKGSSVLIEAPAQSGSQLHGTIKLYKTRFAHVAVDLSLDKIIPTRVRNDFASQQKISSNDLPTHWRFNLKDSRKIKPGELHYIDHPHFGVLVKISTQ
jgi:hypothetical protein